MKRFPNDKFSSTFNYFLCIAYTFYLNLLENHEKNKDDNTNNQFLQI